MSFKEQLHWTSVQCHEVLLSEYFCQQQVFQTSNDQAC